jgi:tetratricopeptide (TPR) repeat protein
VAPLFPFTKYIIRSDVIYTRDPPLCNSPQDKTAYELFQKGELLAEEGKTEDAINLFRRAFKLSPELATIMGQS